MTEIRQLKVDENLSILIETVDGPEPVEQFEPGVSQTGAIEDFRTFFPKVKELPDTTFDAISSTIISFSKRLLSKFDGEFGDQRPSITLEYGIGITAEASVKVVQAAGEATIKVTVSFEPR